MAPVCTLGPGNVSHDSAQWCHLANTMDESSGVLLKMEVGIRKRVWQRAWRYRAYLWSLRWVYAIKKTPEVGIRRIPPNAPLFLPFWYRLTRVVLEKGPLNGCVCVCVPSKQEILIDSKCRLSAATIWQWEPRDTDLYLSTDDCLFRQRWLHVLHYADIDTAVFFRRETSSHSRSQPSLLICCLVTSRLTSVAE